MHGIANHAVGKHRPNRYSATPTSLLRAIKLWYTVSALLHSPNGRVKRRHKFAFAESGDVVLLFPRLTAYTRRGNSRQRDDAQEDSEEEKLAPASSACRHAGGVKVAAPNALTEPHTEDNQQIWAMLVAKFPSERPHRCFRGRVEHSAIERHRDGAWKCPSVALGR